MKPTSVCFFWDCYPSMVTGGTGLWPRVIGVSHWRVARLGEKKEKKKTMWKKSKPWNSRVSEVSKQNSQTKSFWTHVVRVIWPCVSAATQQYLSYREWGGKFWIGTTWVSSHWLDVLMGFGFVRTPRPPTRRGASLAQGCFLRMVYRVSLATRTSGDNVLFSFEGS